MEQPRKPPKLRFSWRRAETGGGGGGEGKGEIGRTRHIKRLGKQVKQGTQPVRPTIKLNRIT